MLKKWWSGWNKAEELQNEIWKLGDELGYERRKNFDKDELIVKLKAEIRALESLLDKKEN